MSSKVSSAKKKNDCMSEILKLDDPTNKDIISAISASHSSLNLKIDKMNETVEYLLSENKKNQERISNLEKKSKTQSDASSLLKEQFSLYQCNNDQRILKLTDEVKILHTTSNSAMGQISYFEQKELANDIIISGLPICEKLSSMELDSIIKSISNFYNHEMNDISFTTKRNSSDNRNFQIIVRFNTNLSKRKLMNRIREQGPIYIKALFPELEGDNLTKWKLYINDRLTNYNYKLLKQLRILKKNGKLFAVWYHDCHIYARTSKESPVLLIKTNNDVNNLIDV